MGETIARVLREEGVDVRLGTEATSVGFDGAARIVRLADRTRVRSSQLLVAMGRKPRVAESDLEALGIAGGRLQIDRRCRIGKGAWAIGDVTGVMPFTHVAKYQARIVARDIRGERVAASYDAIPRVTFCDPELAAVGLTEQQAREREIDVTAACVELPAAIARPSTYEREPRGLLGLVADRRRGVLVGAWAAAPLASEWIHQAALAIKARIPLRTVRDTVAQFPTFSEAYLSAVEKLDPAALRNPARRPGSGRGGNVERRAGASSSLPPAVQGQDAVAGAERSAPNVTVREPASTPKSFVATTSRQPHIATARNTIPASARRFATSTRCALSSCRNSSRCWAAGAIVQTAASAAKTRVTK